MKLYQARPLFERWWYATDQPLNKFLYIFPDGEVVPNMEALDDWLQPNEGESVQQCLERIYGRKATYIIETLLKN